MSDTTPPAADGQVPPPPPQQPAPAAAAPYTAAEDQNMAAWAHLGTILSFLPPLIIWLIGKDRGPRTNVEGKEALNFGITTVILYVAISIVNGVLDVVTLGIWLLIGWVLPLALFVISIIFAVQGFQKVNQGGSYRYPNWINWRFIK